jgi:transposase InsO family protein
MKPLDPVTLFRLSVIGPLISRRDLARGELQRLLEALAQREYDVPNSRRCHLGVKTIQCWFYRYQRNGVAGLAARPRKDRGTSRLSAELQERILAAKRENPRRSIRAIRALLEAAGHVPRGALSRSAIHRLLRRHGLSRIEGTDSQPEERRRFVAGAANDIWYADVMHGPRLSLDGRVRKTYLVSLLDDASRLIAHSAFCLAETALDIEGVLKQALLKRGIAAKLVVDNGAAFRAATLQGICARLGIQLIYCRPYQPEGKGKLERYHRTFRAGFLSELDPRRITSLADLNSRLWAWVETVYHRTPHAGLDGQTPLARYQQDLARIRLLGPLATKLDALFWHRVARHVRRDGTVSYEGRLFEVPYELSGRTVQLVVDPHAGVVLGVEDDAGNDLGRATALDAAANAHRRRRKPRPPSDDAGAVTGLNRIELAHADYYGKPLADSTAAEED